MSKTGVKRVRIVSERIEHAHGGAVLCERLPLNGAQFADAPPSAFLILGASFDPAAPPPLDSIGRSIAHAQGNLADALSAACESFNRDIAEFCRARGAEWVEGASGAVVTVSGEKIVLATCGPIAAFITTPEGTTEITESIPTAERQPTALRFFASLIEGELPAHGRLAVVSATLFAYIDKDAFTKLLNQKELKKLTSHLNGVIKNAKESVFGLFIEPETSKDTSLELFNEVPTMLERPRASITNHYRNLSAFQRTTVILAALAFGLFATAFVGLHFTKTAKLAETKTPTPQPAPLPTPVVAGEAEPAPESPAHPPLVAFPMEVKGTIIPLKDSFGVVDYVRNTFAIYTYDGTASKTLELGIDVAYATETDTGMFLVDAQKKIYHWSADKPNLAKVGTLDPSEGTVIYYNGRLYALGTTADNFTVARYDVDIDTKKIGARTVWASAATTATDMAIDGSIFVNTKEGTQTFFKGKRSTPDFAGSGTLWTAEEAEELFVLHDGRLDVFEKKEGKLIKTIALTSASDAVDFFVDLKRKEVFLLSPKEVRTIPLE
ncbi:MAG: hypothetical protein Q7S89_02365 [bacterium]|nr:hypothetical protein [bacterium]